ncbi:hypothetical protein [Streptomyces sp. NPDC127066]|uniref:hypothetical protein n=1 Tax=Streptomyces sp. NPDC127066 TaxID=3347125 RepID=UPI0036462353
MFIQPWDAALDDTERRTWIADGHDFGIRRLTERGTGLDTPTAARQLRRPDRIAPWKP